MNEGMQAPRSMGVVVLAAALAAMTACVSVPSSGETPSTRTAGLSVPPASDAIRVLRQICEPDASVPRSGTDIHDCYYRQLHEIVQTQGATIGMHALYRLAGVSERFAHLCHVTAHHLAETMYAQVENIGEAMALCQEQCSYACQHAVLTSYLRDLPQGTLPDLDRLCPQNPPHPYSLSHRQCTHGVGHGLVHHFSDIHEALSICKHFSLPWAQRRCTQGVFMESTIQAHTQASSVPAATHLSLCQTIEPRQRFDCYSYRISLVDWATGSSISAMVAACGTIPVMDRPGCYFGIGKVLSGLYIEREEELVGVCRFGESTYTTECLLGFVSILTNYTGLDRGFRFCARLPDDARMRCSERMGRVVRLQWTAPEQISIECKKAGESPYARACLESALTSEELPPNSH
jgi:hypothetical protein